ncbi:hypothetical protein BASA50_008339 [Batrachochytrium salamandrivorans]|uniref:ERCC1-like central domain-containing protein n=1 Tax=Batrachochytrium salamandrivorans TaxID=1357716 RepID=A0ABQ8F7R8_9FUNG|nr:hypothetical protein BASA62_008416 [Batrachochytrium salamandrivorans]KAH6592056.1 hypothetical protein BASA50_008339 [Batrachochytrium salamandrivorans]KAH6602137.1 hypothetical protein BASA61_001417 [Batrachochytrium salamandrivorans]KAJ1340797.1 hypothetical protein BSLG_004579 [Batrachochytrium salamandrivorans]
MTTAAPSRSRLHTVLVNVNQRGNPVLDNIKNVPWEYGETDADYQVGRSTGVTYLSLKYHRLYPEYINTRLNQIERKFHLRILICVVDVDDHQQAIKELTRTCIFGKVTMILAWSVQEAGRYIETLKSYENKPPDLIKERVETDYFSKLTDAVTSIKSVNKTDVMTLSSNIGSFKDMAHASAEELMLLPGFGEQKVSRFESAFSAPFLLNKDADHRKSSSSD